jgi:hypothetical protein
MIGNRFPAELLWIMEGRWVSVKFGAERLCPKCNRERVGDGDTAIVTAIAGLDEGKQIPRAESALGMKGLGFGSGRGH